MGRRLFTFVLYKEIHKATRLQYPLSLVCLTPDLTLQGNGSLLNRLAREAATRLRATDLATKLESSLALLFVNAETGNLPVIFQRLKEDLELPAGLSLSAGGGCYPQTATSGSEMLSQALELMGRAQAKGGNRLCLPP